LRTDRKGFVFTLDATFAVLVVLVLITGIIRAQGPFYGHDYLRLQRYASDALEVMRLTGAIDNILDLLENDEAEAAKILAMGELREVMPSEVKFRLSIGDNLLTVYPDHTDPERWATEFENVAQRAVAVRVSIYWENQERWEFMPITLYVWREGVG